MAVIRALERALAPRGTLVMPTHSSDYTDPEQWEEPPVPKSWYGSIRDGMPLFDPEPTPTRSMGRIPGASQKQKRVLRSGPLADYLS